MQETKKTVPHVAPEELAQMLRERNDEGARVASSYTTTPEIARELLDCILALDRLDSAGRGSSPFARSIRGNFQACTFALAVRSLEGTA